MQIYFSPSTKFFYSDEDHGTLGQPGSTVPADAVAVTGADHAALMLAVEAGQEIVADGAGYPLAQPPALPPLGDAKTTARATVDAQAEAARLQFITGGVGQSMTYELKHGEAVAYAADTAPDPANYPMLTACIGSDGASLSDVASTIIATRNLWVTAAAEIEGTRRQAKWSISNAADHTAIETILAGLTWPVAS